MKNILIVCLLFVITNNANAQVGAMTIANHSPCSVTVTPYATAVLEGYNCSCVACQLVGMPVTIASGAPGMSFTDYNAYQTFPGWQYGASLSAGVTDFIWEAADFSYDCSYTSFSGCGPSPNTVGDACSCVTTSTSFSYSTVSPCPAHTFSVTWAPPPCPGSGIVVAIDLY